MKKLLAAAVISAVTYNIASGQVPITNVITNAFDFGGNYDGTPGWTNGANAGFGFGAWQITTEGGGSKGAFIGNPSAAGIGGMSTESFGLYANSASDARVGASRSLNSALAVGETFSFQWGVNFNSGAKGINVRSGGTQIFNLNVGNFSDNITVNGNAVLTSYGTNSFYVGFTRLNATTYNIFSTSARNNSTGGGFSTNLTISDAMDSFEIYARDLNSGDAQQPYFNDFSVTTIPEPSTYALLALSAVAFGGYVVRRRRR